ncbi:lipopolysaccharide biosynthesis protein [Bifidobacterium pullorum subsp. saeculare]|uniref:rhamnan synthesis F family protein n=1 Tax=Bifidobacterium pullorum TaxID=78448 RepID=UPI00195C2E74|nr:rhamnan synthesis F family protein [Bifidobacterium pullorum]MBM6691918.1 lipopolysaccharide biosynthesis protein [Bifidobacterium pullorum subsp. saeculare]
MGVERKMDRLGIYCFYDMNGHASSFIDFFLKSLRPYLSDLIIVVNGKLDSQSRDMFLAFTDKIIIRENKGLDAAAYRQVMLTLGWQKLSDYDEIICLNDTVLGPIYPFSEMFDVMDAKDVDFWGITTYNEEHNADGTGIPEHLQAYWHAYRRSLVQSESFHRYWEQMPVFDNYADVTHKHEIPFTKHFSDLGFTWAAYVDCRKYTNQSHYPLLYMPMQLVRDERCPIIKRRCFFLDYDFYFSQTAGQSAMELYEYIKDYTEYDCSYIWDAVLPSYNIYNIAEDMHLNYVLPSRVENPSSGKHVKAAFIFHIFFLDLLNQTFRYLINIPDEVDLYVTTTEDKITSIREAMHEFGLSHDVTFIPVQNRGRDVSALLVGARDVVLNREYDVIGFAHDKKSSQNQKNGHNGTETDGFTYKLMENTLGSKPFVRNVLTLFADNARLGMVCPPPPYHALYFAHTLPSDWGPNFDMTKDLLTSRLHLCVPLDISKSTHSAMGSCYWFRVDALRPLLEYPWRYEDFLPEGEMGADGSISHAIERANGYVTQAQGYYPAWVLSDRYARIEVDSLFHVVNSMLLGMGPHRQGETMLQVTNSMSQQLNRRGRIIRFMRRNVHLGLKWFTRHFVQPLPKPVTNVLYRAAWWPIRIYRSVRDFLSGFIRKR